MKSLFPNRWFCVFVTVLASLLCVLFSGCGGKTSYLSGRVLCPDKSAGVTISVYDTSGRLLMKESKPIGQDGRYNIAYKKKMPSTFIIAVTGKKPAGKAFPVTLKRVVNQYNPHRYYEINGLTTLVALYLDRRPKAGYDGAVTAVRTYLRLPDNETFAEVSAALSRSDAWVSDAALWEKLIASGSLDAVMNDIEAGRVIDLSDKSLTADLRPLFGSGGPAAKVAMAKKVKEPSPMSAFGSLLGFVGDIFEGVTEIMDMQEEEKNIETLNRIDENIEKMAKQLSDIHAQTDRIETRLAESQWTQTNKELRKIEQGCIAPAREALSEVLAYKKQMILNPPANASEARDTLAEKVDRFRELMEKPECNGLNFKSYESLLNSYASTVTCVDEDKANSAIQLYANVMSAKSNDMDGCPECTYKSIENTFLRFIYYQATGLQLYLHHELNKKKLSKSQQQKKQKEIVTRFIQGTREYDRERMIKQVGRFVPAVESFVVSHDNEPYYRRWLECDNVNSLKTDPGSGKCQDYERPFLRSQIIADQLLGHIRNGSGNIEGSKHGFYLKAIQLKSAYIDDGLRDKKFIIKMPDGSDRELSPVETKLVPGKNPYRVYGEAESAKWHVATYRIEGKDLPDGKLAFELKHDANDTATPIHFRGDISLESVKDAGSGKYYNALSVWSVPVREVKTFYMAVNRGWGAWAYFPYSVSGCNDEACTSITAALERMDGDGSRLRLYRIGAELNNVAIGYRKDGKRYLFLPSNVWEWPHGGGSFNKFERTDAFAAKEMRSDDGYSKIHWYMEHDPSVAWGNATYFSRTDGNEKKYLAYFQGTTDLFCDPRLADTNVFKISFDGNWK